MESQNIQLMELMKLRDKRRERVKGKKAAWSCLWMGVGSLLGFPICRYLIFDGYPTIGKWMGGIFLGLGIMLVIAYPFGLLRCKKLTQEVEELDREIKDIENSIR